ncbi:MAG: thioredoxin [Candidatus Hydrogenedentota bacterium]
MTEELNLNEENFKSEVLESDIPVLVDFWAPWCSPCRMLAPLIEKISEKYLAKIKVRKINVDDNSSLASQFSIRGIPTLVVFKSGKEVDRIVGLVSLRELEDKLDRVLV